MFGATINILQIRTRYIAVHTLGH